MKNKRQQKQPRKKTTKVEEEVVRMKPTIAQLALLADSKKKYDPNATKEDCIRDLREMFTREDRFISRDYYRLNGTYSERVWTRYFGTMEEFRSEAGLQPTRHAKKIEKDTAKHAALDCYRKFYRLEIEPWVEKYPKATLKNSAMKKMVVGSDIHDIEADMFVLSVFLDTCRVEQPDIIVLNGDTFDMYEFSHFDTDPRKVNLGARMQFVRDHVFAPLRRACPDAQIDFIIGNHEHRLLKHIASKSPQIFCLMDVHDLTLTQLLGLDKFEINLVSKGNTSAYKPKEIKAEVKKNYKVYFETVVVNHYGNEDFGLLSIGGHTHRPEMTTQTLISTGPINHVTLGCMCKLDAEYTKTKENWQQGFGIVYIDSIMKRGQVHQILFNEYFANVNGRYYFRNTEDTAVRDTLDTIDAIKEMELKGFVHNDAETAIVAGWEKSVKAKAI